MTDERKLELFDEVLNWVSELLSGYDLYEWARHRGMTDEEIAREFSIDDYDMKEYQGRYKEDYRD